MYTMMSGLEITIPGIIDYHRELAQCGLSPVMYAINSCEYFVTKNLAMSNIDHDPRNATRLHPANLPPVCRTLSSIFKIAPVSLHSTWWLLEWLPERLPER